MSGAFGTASCVERMRVVLIVLVVAQLAMPVTALANHATASSSALETPVRPRTCYLRHVLTACGDSDGDTQRLVSRV